MKRLLCAILALLLMLPAAALADTDWMVRPTKIEDLNRQGCASAEEAILTLLAGLDRSDYIQVWDSCLAGEPARTFLSQSKPEEHDQFLDGLQFVELVDLLQSNEYAQSQEFLAALKEEVTGIEVTDMATGVMSTVDAEAVVCAAAHVIVQGRDAWMIFTPVRVGGLWYNHYCKRLWQFSTWDRLFRPATGSATVERLNAFGAFFTPVILPAAQSLTPWELAVAQIVCAPEVQSAVLDSGMMQIDDAVFAIRDKETAEADPGALTVGQLCAVLGQTPLNGSGERELSLEAQHADAWIRLNLHPGTLDHMNVQILIGYAEPLSTMRITGTQMTDVRGGTVWSAGGIGRDGQRHDGGQWTQDELFALLAGQGLTPELQLFNDDKQVNFYNVTTPHGGEYQFEVDLNGLLTFFFRNL